MFNMKLREELRHSVLKKLKDGSDPLEGFFAPEEVKETILAILVAGRHLLLEGPPGTGKTTLAKIIASLLPPMQIVEGCRFGCDPQKPNCPDCKGKKEITGVIIPGSNRFVRVQGSHELMPEDLVGEIDPVAAMTYGVRDPRAFTPGKIQKAHRKILFIDELNRVPERTQSALLQVLEEGATTIAGFDIEIDVDTLVIATQNPEEYAGAERISETLKDRFERAKIWYPTKEQEIEILRIYGNKIENIEVPENIMDKIVTVSQLARSRGDIEHPPSVRTSLSIFEQTQAIAKIRNRKTVQSEELKKAAKMVLMGRLSPSIDSNYYERPELFIDRIIEEAIGS